MTLIRCIKYKCYKGFLGGPSCTWGNSHSVTVSSVFKSQTKVRIKRLAEEVQKVQICAKTAKIRN